MCETRNARPMVVELLQSLGYRLNIETLHKEFLRGIGKQMTELEEQYFQWMAPYVVLAYQQGLKQGKLDAVFCFLENVDNGHTD